jgi:hypothetical protein
MGYRKIESDNDIPPDYSTLKDDDPYPINIFGLSKPISSKKIDDCLTTDFYHYLNIYKNTKQFGLPYHSWIDAPKWLLTLFHSFTDIENEYERYKKVKGLI